MKGRLLKKCDVDQLPTEVRPLYATTTRAPLTVVSSPAPPAPMPEAAADRQVRLLNRIVGEFVRERERLLQELRPELLQIAMAIAGEIIQHEVTVDPAVIDATLAECLLKIQYASRVVVRLHPDDLAHLRGRSQREEKPGLELEFMADTSIARGGCLIESDCGGMDATIETQLRLLGEHLKGVLVEDLELREASGA